MKPNFRHTIFSTVTLIAALAAMVSSCASMGRPEGGPRDIEPPTFVSSNPAPGQLNVTNKRLRVYFNENVQINNPSEKVVVSPVQKTPPAISANGHYVQVEFRDTMIPDMTYTVDFADAIRDLNEGNILDGFALDFSTGSEIDTLRISGMVLQASNLEPAQGMIVGVYSNMSDTAIRTLPFERITKTNQLGQFTIRNLKPGSYRIFAVNDMNRDYHWDRSEDVAFYDTTITPTAKRIEIADTLRSSEGTDSVVSRIVTAYEPNDILLTWFNENYRSQYLAKNERPERRRLHFEFGAPSDTFPTIRVLSGKLVGTTADRWSVMTSSATRDTINYWITDTLVSGLDSLMIEARYLRTDTADRLSWTTDTLRMFLRGSNTRKAELKREAELAEKRRKAMEKGDTLPEPAPPMLDLRGGSNTIDVHLPLTFTTSEPIVDFDTTAVRLEIKVDTIWKPAAPPKVTFPKALDPTMFQINYKWEPGARYRLSIDSASVGSAWGVRNKPFELEMNVMKLEDYSTIKFDISGLPDSIPAFVELLNKQDMPVSRATVKNHEAELEFLKPAEYYARLIIDANGNGKYDEGSLTDSLQPEEVYYYPKRLKLKKNWDIRQSWNVFELPLDQQKPLDIKKNKPAKKSGETDPNNDDDEEDEDEFYQDDFFNPGSHNDRFSNRTDRNNRHSNRSMGGYSGY